MEEDNLRPYVEGALGRWFPVTKESQESPFWQADKHRKAVYDQFKAGTRAVRVHEELQVRHPEQRERLGEGDEPRGQREGAGRQGGRRADRPHQASSGLIQSRRSIAATISAEFPTQPKMPPCALIILRPMSWNSGKYEPTQSSGTRQS